MGLWFDFPSRCFPSLAGTGRGRRGNLSCLSLRQGKDSLSAFLRKERMASGAYSGGPGALELEPKHRGGECLHCFLMWAPPWGVAVSQEVPCAWVDAQPHPDKGQLWGLMGTGSGQARAGGLGWRTGGGSPDLMWFRSHPLFPPCIILWV